MNGNKANNLEFLQEYTNIFIPKWFVIPAEYCLIDFPMNENMINEIKESLSNLEGEYQVFWRMINVRM